MKRTASRTFPDPKNTATIVAKLDLTNEGQRRLHDFIRRMHTGRWPTLRALGMRQLPDGTIIEAAEWLRTLEPSYMVIEWRSDGNGLRMQQMKSRHSAQHTLRSAR